VADQHTRPGRRAARRIAYSTASVSVLTLASVAEEVGAAKPDPAIFDAAFERLGRNIGESLTSDIGGRNYGPDTC
jgi:FMN phosphatase YigB (HAD superfamily)